MSISFRSLLSAGMLLIFFTSILSSQEEYEKKQSSARKAKAKGDLTVAVREYGMLVKDKSIDTKKLATINLEYAGTLEKLATEKEKSNPNLLQQARDAYQVVITSGSVFEQNVARNNLANLYLKQGNTDAALKNFSAIQWDQVPAAQRFVYHYNYGRAMESNLRPNDSFDQYMSCLTDQPEFTPAVDSAMRIILKDEQGGISKAVSLSSLLLLKGNRDKAYDVILRTLDQLGGRPDAQRLLAKAVEYYTETSSGPFVFQQSERGRLLDLKARYSNLQMAILDIDSIYLKLEPFSSRDVFAWADETWKKEAFMPFLIMVGRAYEAAKEYTQALNRYMFAWSWDRENSEAVLAATTLLRDHSDVLDPDKRIFNSIVDRLFLQKGEAYLGDDLKNILRLHTVLGTIFERERKWGSEFDSHSAIFQWKHAVEIDKQLNRKDPEHPLSPGLYTHLGDCYLNTGQTHLAAEAYLTSAELFHAQSKFESKQALQKALSVSDALDDQDKQRLESLQMVIH